MLLGLWSLLLINLHQAPSSAHLDKTWEKQPAGKERFCHPDEYAR